MDCSVSLCEEPAKFEVTFVTGDTYAYCDDHGWRFSKGWVNIGHKETMVASCRYAAAERTFTPVPDFL